MFSIGFYIGILAYLIYALGLLGFLYLNVVIISGCLYIFLVLCYERKNICKTLHQAKLFLRSLDRFEKVLILIIIFQAAVNLVGALGPELGFDALWYHLTLPKLYLLNHKILHIPGSLLYYTDMSKLTEMLYIFGLSLGSAIFAKTTHYLFGLLILVSIYSIARKFLNKELSLIAVVIFYSNLVVGWQSISAYIDLSRTFFELLSFWAFLNWFETKEKKWLIESACLLGLAISTKLLALGALIVFITTIIFISKNKIKDILTFVIFSLMIPMPWFIFSFVYNNNIVYPFFTNIYPVKLSYELFNPFKFVSDLFTVFLKSSDPINPMYLLFILISVRIYKKFKKEQKVIFSYCMLSLAIWYITPRTGGGRFILPYLPMFSLLSILVIQQIKKEYVKRLFIGLIIFFSIFSVVYRAIANSKFTPVIFGIQTRSDFLENHLNFYFGDFYDIDGYFKQVIKQNDIVLLYGFHNLYYVDFPFIDSTWIKKGDRFSYIATQNSGLPERFKYWNIIYENKKTHVKLYTLGGQKWLY